jgi:hypothetical protein
MGEALIGDPETTGRTEFSKEPVSGSEVEKVGVRGQFLVNFGMWI